MECGDNEMALTAAELRLRFPAVITNEKDAWRELAAEPGLCLHLYGKRDAREGRKMGHATRLLPKGTRG